ncbi:MAG TPA: MBOAT family protein, partial [Bacteroidia bacterium]
KGGLVFAFVTMAWLLFKLPKFEEVIEFCKALFHNYRKEDNIPLINYILLYSFPVVAYHAMYLLNQKNRMQLHKIDFIIYGLMLFMIAVNSGPAGSFIYFQF